ncbi:MAG: ABC transporter substrate-binding protein [Actinomycetota bacterium]|nr:ABC transporter substrate-binding protein [Actinomycetota bacterium]
MTDTAAAVTETGRYRGAAPSEPPCAARAGRTGTARYKAVAVTASLSLLAAACGSTTSAAHGSGPGSGAKAASTTLVVGADNGSPTLADNFNPFSPNARIGTSYMYEPLQYVNTLNGSYSPMLATSHRFVNPTTLQFTIRSGARWSDGKPITPSDVLFTFDMLKKFPALDSAGIWKHVSSVTASGNTVTFVFSAPDVPFAQVIASTVILPQHVWSSVSDPATFTNTSPVVSGPFKLGTFNPNQYTLVKNPQCWQASKVAVTKVVFPALTGNQTSQLELARGQYSWATLFVPNINQDWVSKAPQYNHYWFPPGGTISLYMNLAKAPFDSLAFRKALSYGLDRSSIAAKAENGYVHQASQSGILLPNLSRWLDPSLPNSGKVSYDPAKAKAMLASAGYKLSGGKLLSPSGQPVRFSILTPSGFSDWLQAAQVIEQELAKLGITVTVSTPQYAGYSSALQNGQFDTALGGFGGSGSPYIDLHGLLASSLSAPVGQSAPSNYERWQSSSTDALLHTVATTTDPAAQKAAIYKLEGVMYHQLPVLALFYGATWGEYSTKNFVGWPTASNPYAPPAPYGEAPLAIMTHLRPAG